MTIVFGTGHRPEDCDVTFNNMIKIAYKALRDYVPEVEVAVCGMAGGWDLAFGGAAVRLDIPIWVVRPWQTHRVNHNLYKTIRERAEREIVTSDSRVYPGPWVYQIRNEWMVDNSDLGFALWSGKKSGGTYNTLKYAQKRGVPVTNLYPS